MLILSDVQRPHADLYFAIDQANTVHVMHLAELQPLTFKLSVF